MYDTADARTEPKSICTYMYMVGHVLFTACYALHPVVAAITKSANNVHKSAFNN